MTLCFAIFQLSTATDFYVYGFYICYLGIFGGQVLLLCFYGQKLIDSSVSIAEGAYQNEWETLGDNGYKKFLILTIAQAHKSKRLTAMNFAEISLQSFIKVS